MNDRLYNYVNVVNWCGGIQVRGCCWIGIPRFLGIVDQVRCLSLLTEIYAIFISFKHLQRSVYCPQWW